MKKPVVLAIVFSFIPIWKDDMTNRGLNLWEYIRMFIDRDDGGGQHLPVDEAIENMRRNTYP